MIRFRLATVVPLTLLAAAVLAAGALAAGAIGIYNNDMESGANRSELRLLAGKTCERGGSTIALKVEVGTKTEECQFATPVVGRDLEIIATGRLLSGTPTEIRKKIYIAVNLRVGGGGKYQLAVFPRIDKYTLRKDVPDSERQTLAVGQARRIQGIDKANEIRLRAFPLLDTRDKDDVRLLVYINGKRFEVITDEEGGPLKGRYSTVSVGVNKGFARGAIASFDDVVVRVPSPFES